MQQLERLERHAAALGVSAQLEITGFLPQAEALKRAAAADIGLSPIHRSPIYDVGSPTNEISAMSPCSLAGTPRRSFDNPSGLRMRSLMKSR